jgi:hypothetical protein
MFELSQTFPNDEEVSSSAFRIIFLCLNSLACDPWVLVTFRKLQQGADFFLTSDVAFNDRAGWLLPDHLNNNTFMIASGISIAISPFLEFLHNLSRVGLRFSLFLLWFLFFSAAFSNEESLPIACIVQRFSPPVRVSDDEHFVYSVFDDFEKVSFA